MVIGLGTELKSHYTDFAGISKEKADFWEAVNGKLMYYAGVLAEGSDAPEEARVIQFPKGEYVVVKGEDKSAEALHEKVTGIAFGQALPEATDVAYVGGPNASVVKGQQDGLFYGEMLIPVVRK
ncbi:MAG TPA: effector binding domain-containing protein [Bacillales bacterium]|nr:effector binding domain-containing protein [Bacillales bacterium]